MSIFYRVHMDATDHDGTDVTDMETAIKLMNEFNETREPGDADWKWSYIEKIEENVSETFKPDR